MEKSAKVGHTKAMKRYASHMSRLSYAFRSVTLRELALCAYSTGDMT